MLSYEEILLIHQKASELDHTAQGILSSDAIHSAIGQPLQTFGGVDLYEGVVAKAAALGYFLTKAHGFQDGNKRVGYMAMKIALLKEGYHLKCDPDDGEYIILSIAEGESKLEDLTEWVEDHIYPCRENALVRVTDGMEALLEPFDAIAKIMEVHNRARDGQIADMNACLDNPPSSRVKLDKIRGGIFERAAKNMNFTATRLRFELQKCKDTVEDVTEYAPFVSDHVDFSEPTVRAAAEQLASTISAVVSAHDRVVDNFQFASEKFQETAELGVDAKMAEAADNLSTALNEASVLFNDDWFAWKDVFDGLAVSLKGN
jgi:death-on-curing protein